MENPKYKKFAMEYVTNGKNQTQAAIAAGYSPRSAYSQGNRLLNNDEVLGLIKEFEADLRIAYEDKIRDEIASQAFYRIGDYIRIEDGEIVFQEDAINDATMSRVIKQIEQTQNGIRIVFYDKQKALDQLIKIVGMDQPKEDNNDTVRVVFEENVEELMENG